MNRYISKAMLEHALNVDCNHSLLDGVLSFSGLKPYQSRTIEGLKKEFLQLGRISPSLALDYIEDSFKYFDSVREYCENTGLSFEYLYGLFGILRAIAAQCQTVPRFLLRIEELEQLFEGQRDLKNKDLVTLTTMHSSKGLEYDVVLMIDLTNDEIPGWDTRDQKKRPNDEFLLEEERRLFYVGMTRAKEHLYMISPEIKNGIVVPRSLFVDETAKCMNLKVIDGIGEGVIVNHKHFGTGIIAAVLEQANDRTVLEIDFKGIRRKLDFLICIENGLISF